MTLRKVPGTLALGLVVSLAAHAALYGGEHSVGGAYHALLLQAATGGLIGLVFLLGSLAWSGAKHASDGTILATRLGERLPSLGGLAASGSLWYLLTELAEPHHTGVATPAVAVALAVAAALVALLTRTAVRAVAVVIFAVARPGFSTRTPSWTRRPGAAPLVRRPGYARRRFARPPPIAIAARA